MALRHRRRFQVDIEVTRRGPVVRVDGHVEPDGEPEVFKIKGGLQPGASPKEMDRLPEGTRTDAVVQLWTDADLLLTEPNEIRADRIRALSGRVFVGVEFEISAVEQWPGHRKYLAIKTGQ